MCCWHSTWLGCRGYEGDREREICVSGRERDDAWCDGMWVFLQPKGVLLCAPLLQDCNKAGLFVALCTSVVALCFHSSIALISLALWVGGSVMLVLPPLVLSDVYAPSHPQFPPGIPLRDDNLRSQHHEPSLQYKKMSHSRRATPKSDGSAWWPQSRSKCCFRSAETGTDHPAKNLDKLNLDKLLLPCAAHLW